MTGQADGRAGRGTRWRLAGWGTVAGLLLLPWLAGAPWTLFDYVAAGVILGGAGLVLELVLRAPGSLSYRAGAGVAVAAAVLLIWVTGAVGFIGDEDNPANLLFFGVLAVVVLGSVLARFRAAGMARTLFTTAAVQVAVGLTALGAQLGAPGDEGLYEAVMGTSVFAALWLVSAGLFRNAAEESSATMRS